MSPLEGTAGDGSPIPARKERNRQHGHPSIIRWAQNVTYRLHRSSGEDDTPRLLDHVPEVIGRVQEEVLEGNDWLLVLRRAGWGWSGAHEYPAVCVCV
jgi:hypothetical protein